MSEAEMNEIEALDRAHVFTSWSVQQDAAPKEVVDADGVRFTDADGNTYLDLSSQLMCSHLGHNDSRITDAIADQAQRVAYVAPKKFTTEVRARLGHKLAQVTPGNLHKTFFTPSGAEAVEAALKVARFYTGKYKVMARYRTYHGATFGAISLTGETRRLASEPALPGVIRAPDVYPYRSTFSDPMRTLDYIDEILCLEGDTVGAVFVEPVVGSNGVIVPPDGYLPRLKEICHSHGALLVADEVMSGFGRTGEWFAVDHWDVTPDIMTMAKGLSAAYLPIGAAIVSDEIAEFFETATFAQGHTYAAHPLTCAAALRTIQVYEEDELMPQVKAKGAQVEVGLHELQERHPSIGEVRGLGLFWGLELVQDRETKAPMPDSVVKAVAKRCMELGAHVIAMRSVIVFAPPLVIADDELEEGMNLIDRALEVADRHASVEQATA